MGLQERFMTQAKTRMLAIRFEKYAGSRPVFDVALEREHWDLAALCLMVGVFETFQKLPRDMVGALMDELEGELPPHHGSRARAKRGPHARRR